jgi:hypothetical protein
VKQMEEAKMNEPRMGLCNNGSKETKWGPTLVERQRRIKTLRDCASKGNITKTEEKP